MSGSDVQARMDDRRQFGLLWAVAASVGVHLILLLLGEWLPLVRHTEVARVVEESVLRFDFAPPSEVEQEARPAGQVPLDTPPPRANAPALSPPSSSASPPPAAPTRPEAQPVPPEQAVAGAERPRDLAPDPAPAEPTLRNPGASEQGREDASERGASETRPTRRLNLDQALQDFGQLLEQARDASPRSSNQVPPRNVFVPDLGSFPTTGYGIGNLMFETREFDWSDYARQIYNEIWKAWHRRLYQTTDDFEKWALRNRSWVLEHEAHVRFVIERDGDVTGIRVEAVSGCPPLDASAADALDEVILPRLPPTFPKDREVVHARFIAIGDIRNMRRQLKWLRDNGFF